MAPNKTAPAKKAGGVRVAAPASRQSPIGMPQYLTLEDGTQVPMQIPPGMPPAQAQAMMEYLKNNPAAAKAAYEQAQVMLKNPALAQSFLNMPSPTDPAASQAALERFNVLKDDPELKDVFEDMQKNGAAAMSKYWEDQDLMVKISQKLRMASLTGGAEGSSSEPEAPAKPKTIGHLHDAAKFGDIEAATQMIESGSDVNQKNERGISPLGIAVGFNRVDMVKHLIEKGADLHFRDPKGNNLVHYAAGYGRQQIAEILLDAGADGSAENNDKQTPIDVAKLNREVAMEQYLKKKLKVVAAA